ncbi:MAG: heparinase II/III family protein [Armatimonadota bacterium]|nr:heparinase II/III family protein [Armatimonadota bacterium]
MSWGMLSPTLLVVATSALFTGAAPLVTVPAPDEVLRGLRQGHPRLILDAACLARVRQLVADDPVPRRWYEGVKREAEKTLTLPPSTYRKPDGRRLLSVSRQVKDRVETLGLVYRMEGDRRFLERAWAELNAAANFPDWNPSHFLDTAEMTYGFAIGLDWFYDGWSEEQRRVLREAIVRLGLTPGLRVYERQTGWHTNENNWNQVCNGGMGVGALAVADAEPQLAGRILSAAIKSIPLAMHHYAPDGAGTEGVTYWSYGTRYNLLLLSALETALGTDFGLSQIEGFGISGDYQMYLSGADRTSFNFADCGLARVSTPQHFWLARRYNRPQYSWFRYSELTRDGWEGGVFDLIWYEPSGRGYDPAQLPLHKHFRKAECASMRSSWTDPRALVLAIQAGDNSNLGGHRHLDLGSFILEALGERWIVDLGTERQTYLSHQHSFKRWEFYRIRAEGHNTLVMNPTKAPDQEPRAKAAINPFDPTPARARAVVDLTAAYGASARRVERVFTMENFREVRVADEVDAPKPADLWWFAHTGAVIALSEEGRVATLSRNEKRLRVYVEEPADARFTVMEARPLPGMPDPPIQAKNDGVRKLAIHLPSATRVRIVVRFAPEWP